MFSLTSHWDVAGAVKVAPKDNLLYQEPVAMMDEAWRFADFEQFFGSGSEEMMIPLRPQWSYEQTKESLESEEQAHFKAWMESIYSKTPDRSKLSYFEQNIEVWRQFWRVCEVSDVVVSVADIRNPVLHLPPSFCDFIVRRLKKPLVIALSKADLVPERLLRAWEDYIRRRFPSVHISAFSIYESASMTRKTGKRYVKAQGISELLENLSALTPKYRDQWAGIIASSSARHLGKPELGHEQRHQKADDGLFTIGFIGQPNVGKSSLINAIFGRKVVSASRTPGHTKHFQTLHLSPNVRVCDCPGLVFPAIIEKELQILAGLYNIAQVSDPYGPVLSIARRINLPSRLGFRGSEPLSVLDLCELYARKCGFFTSKAGRPDMYRAANQILRLELDGRILVNWFPPGHEVVSEGDDDSFASLSGSDESETSADEFEREDSPTESQDSGHFTESNGFDLLSLDE
jgi:ribosome biogenesis GTPase A